MCQNQPRDLQNGSCAKKSPNVRNRVNKGRPSGRVRKLKHTNCFSPATSYLTQNKGSQEANSEMILVIWLTREWNSAARHVWVTLKHFKNSYEIVLYLKKGQKANLRFAPVFEAGPKGREPKHFWRSRILVLQFKAIFSSSKLRTICWLSK